MKFTAKRLIGAGVIGIAAIVAPISLTVVSSGTTAATTSNSCPDNSNSTYDEICYVQSATSPPDTYQYVPAGAAVPTVTQTATMNTTGGKCATATSTPPTPELLKVCGVVYASSNYAGGSSPANLGTNGTSTGVGAVSPAWTIDNKQNSKTQAEAIDFSPDAGVGNRAFKDASIQIQRKDSGVSSLNNTVTVQLAELDSSGNWVTQDCTIPGGSGTLITADADTSGTGNCGPAPEQGGGTAPPTFHTVEVRDLSTTTSIMVVNTSVFTLQNQVCTGDQPLQPLPLNNGNLPPGVQAGLTIQSVPGGGINCKNYTAYTYNPKNSQGNQELDFNASSASPALSVASGHDGVDVSTFTGTQTLYVSGTQTQWPNEGDLVVATSSAAGTAMLSYTMKGSGTFTDVTLVSGSGLLLPGGAVTSVVPFNINVMWAPVLACQPTPDDGQGVYPGTPPTGLGTCPVSEFQLNGTPFYDELFCAQAGTAPNSIDPACVTSKTYSYETVGGVAETVISENWSILSDFSGRF